jgi:Ca2+-binding RTX toxin-like protein
MHKLTRHHHPRNARLIGAAAALTAAAAAAAIAAGPGAAANTPEAHLAGGVLSIEGGNRGDRIAVGLRAGDPAVIQVDIGDDGVADLAFPRADVSAIDLEGGNGDDSLRVDESNGVFTDTIPTTLDGGNGNDRVVGGAGQVTLRGGNGDDDLIGGNGAERIAGGNGNDSVDGNRGNDVAALGNGDDTFTWDPGDGSDTIDGQNGSDTMLFNGANVADSVTLSANGSRLRFFRNPANITMDTTSVERVDFNALGGADAVTVGDLSGTDVEAVNLDLGANDGADDNVQINGSNDRDRIEVTGADGTANVSGLAAAVNVSNAGSGNDALAIEAAAGDDSVDASGLAASSVQLTENGGDGNDTLIGSAGADTLLGEAGDDLLVGGPGKDVLDGGAGANVLIQD